MNFPFFWRKQGNQPQAGMPPLPGHLESDFDPQQVRFSEATQAPKKREYRMTVIAMLSVIANVGMAWSLAVMLPLKEKVPYMAEMAEDGTLREDTRYKVVGVEGVKQRQITYYLKLWAKWLFTIDSQTAKNLPKAAEFTRGNAANEYAEWLRIDRPIARLTANPNLSRELARTTVTYSSDRTVAFIHIEWIERASGIETGRGKKIVQVEHSLLDELISDDPANPNLIGLAITHFAVADQ